MMLIENPISTVTERHAYSGGAFLLAAGEKGKRYAYEDADFIIHQGQISDLSFSGSIPNFNEQLRGINRFNEKFLEVLGELCGKSVEELREKTREDLCLNAQQAKEFGLIDVILPRKKNPKVPPPKELPIWEKGVN